MRLLALDVLLFRKTWWIWILRTRFRNSGKSVLFSENAVFLEFGRKKFVFIAHAICMQTDFQKHSHSSRISDRIESAFQAIPFLCMMYIIAYVAVSAGNERGGLLLCFNCHLTLSILVHICIDMKWFVTTCSRCSNVLCLHSQILQIPKAFILVVVVAIGWYGCRFQSEQIHTFAHTHMWYNYSRTNNLICADLVEVRIFTYTHVQVFVVCPLNWTGLSYPLVSEKSLTPPIIIINQRV